MIFIGVTGSIGSGKTYLSNYYSNIYHDPILNTDHYVKKLYKQKFIQKKILDAIPELETFNLNRLRKIIAHKPICLKIIEKIIHPYVKIAILRFQHRHSKAKLCFVELPLLFEAGYKHMFKYIVTVFTTPTKRLLRIKTRNNFEYKMYAQMEKRQISSYKKASNANCVIYNNGNKFELIMGLENLRKALIVN